MVRYIATVRSGWWWALFVLVALAATAPRAIGRSRACHARTTATLRADTRPASSRVGTAASPLRDDGPRDLDDDDSDDDAGLTAIVSLSPPDERRVGHRALSALAPGSPERDPLLRPPQRDVG